MIILGNMALSRIMIILIMSLLSFTCANKIRVLTMGEGVLPEHDVKAEILNTVSIRNMDKLTICGRLWTPFQPSMTNVLQDVIFIKDMWFLFRYDMRNCENRFSGCTEFYQESEALLSK